MHRIVSVFSFLERRMIFDETETVLFDSCPKGQSNPERAGALCDYLCSVFLRRAFISS